MCSRFLRTFVWTVGSFALWTCWLALAALIFDQLYIITANELSIPEPILRRLEARLEEAGIKATFSRTLLDPSGRILIENVRLSLPAFNEPIITCRSVYVTLSPYYLAMGQLEPREIQLNDLTAFAPAMLSDSGRPEEIVRHLDATIEPARRSITFQHLSAIIADVPVSAHGVQRCDEPLRRG